MDVQVYIKETTHERRYFYGLSLIFKLNCMYIYLFSVSHLVVATRLLLLIVAYEVFLFNMHEKEQTKNFLRKLELQIIDIFLFLTTKMYLIYLPNETVQTSDICKTIY